MLHTSLMIAFCNLYKLNFGNYTRYKVKRKDLLPERKTIRQYVVFTEENVKLNDKF